MEVANVFLKQRFFRRCWAGAGEDGPAVPGFLFGSRSTSQEKHTQITLSLHNESLFHLFWSPLPRHDSCLQSSPDSSQPCGSQELLLDQHKSCHLYVWLTWSCPSLHVHRKLDALLDLKLPAHRKSADQGEVKLKPFNQFSPAFLVCRSIDLYSVTPFWSL